MGGFVAILRASSSPIFCATNRRFRRIACSSFFNSSLNMEPKIRLFFGTSFLCKVMKVLLSTKLLRSVLRDVANSMSSLRYFDSCPLGFFLPFLMRRAHAGRPVRLLLVLPVLSLLLDGVFSGWAAHVALRMSIGTSTFHLSF